MDLGQEIMVRIGDYSSELDRNDEAVTHARECLNMAKTCPCPRCVPDAQLRLGKYLVKANQVEAGLEYIEKARAAFHEESKAGMQGQCLLAHAQAILDSDPAEGTSVDSGSVVNVTISSGAVVVPDVRGATQADAIAELESSGFRVLVTKSKTNEVPPGTVVKQSPIAGVKAKNGSTVTITVAEAAPAPSPTPTTPPTTAPPTTP